MEKSVRSRWGTAEYIAPEVMRQEYDNEKADIWSLGIVLYEMVHGYGPFKANTTKEIYANIKQGKVNYSSTISEDLIELHNAMINQEPDKRPSIDDIMKYTWVKRMKEDNEKEVIEDTIDDNIDDTIKLITDTPQCEVKSIGESHTKETDHDTPILRLYGYNESEIGKTIRKKTRNMMKICASEIKVGNHLRK